MVKIIRKTPVNLVVVMLFGFAALGEDGDLARRVEALERKVQELDPSFRPEAPDAKLAERVEALEQKLDALLSKSGTPSAQPATSAASAALAPSSTRPLERVGSASGDRPSPVEEERLPVAGYMDFHFNKPRGQPGQLDFHRFVLLFGHSFSPRIKFWSELEVEHAFVEGGEEKGELELEQAYLDFLIKPWMNIRAGMVLAPIGIINERHEPPSFNGVERPMVETVIIPSTWFDTGVGFTGELGAGFRYRAYLMAGLDATGFDAAEGLRGGRQRGFQSSMRNPAKVARIEYQGIRRLALGASGYTGHAGFNLRQVNPRVDLFDLDGRYSVGRLDLRGLFAQAYVTRARELNLALEQNFGSSPNVARQLRGWYVEPAIHTLPRRLAHDLVLFTRYERFNTQHKMPEGFLPLPQFDRSAWVVGTTYKPNADVAIKFDYIRNRNRSVVVRPLNSFNVGLGWWF